MGSWNAMTYDGKETILRVVREEADGFFDLVVGHLVDATETYFERFDAARSGALRITSGPNAGDTRVRITPEGLSYEPGDVSGLGTVIEFDPGSFVLTSFGRCNAGTIRGDRSVADRYLNLFFRI